MFLIKNLCFNKYGVEGQTRVSPRKHVHTTWDAHWRQLADTVE